MDDWYGEEERPRVRGCAAGMECVSGIEERLVEYELHLCSGELLRDPVDVANVRLARLLPDEDVWPSLAGTLPPSP